MKAEQRRTAIASFLVEQKTAVAGSLLSECFGVSRQVIVQDIAALRARGYEIRSTHYGYVVQKYPLTERVFQVYHTPEDTRSELLLITSLGGIVADVFVWHKVYGKISAELNIHTLQQVHDFVRSVRVGTSVELMSITGGHHYHTVRADCDQTLDRIGIALREHGYLVAVE